MSSGKWAIRPYRPADKNLIYATWIHSYRDLSAWGRMCRPHTFALGHHAVIDALFERGAQVVAACSAEDPDQVFGWACYEPRPDRVILHYALTKGPFQRFGIASELLAALAADGRPVAVSHMTDVGLKALEAQPALRVARKMAYSPYLAFLPDVGVQW